MCLGINTLIRKNPVTERELRMKQSKFYLKDSSVVCRSLPPYLMMTNWRMKLMTEKQRNKGLSPKP